MNLWEEKSNAGALDGWQLGYCGKRLRNVGHAYGPYDRESYLIYYIKEGRARLTVNGEERLLSGGSVFVNFPHSGCVYRTLEGEPWSIKWFSVNSLSLAGHLAAVGLTPESPVLPVTDGGVIEVILDELYESFDSDTLAARFTCLSLIHRFFSILATEKAPTAEGDGRVLRARELIATHAAEADFSVSRLAALLGLHPNYLSVLFKRELGISPVRAISEQRLQAAKKMLRFTDRPVKEVAYAAGFSDELYFSRAFRAYLGMSPTEFRRAAAYPI